MKARVNLLVALSLVLAARLFAADDLVIADFDGADYGAWRAFGTAFGDHPARGTLPGQMKVDGFQGPGLVNSFLGGDKATGTLTSPAFRIERPYLRFLIGGGGYSNATCMNLLVDGQIVRTATGPNLVPGGSEQLTASAWDVRDLAGREAVIEIVDRATGGWGHINVDQIVQTDRKPPLDVANARRELTITQRYLHFPVKNGARHKKVELLQDGIVRRFFDIELADDAPDWWAFLDVSAWHGQSLVVQVDKLRDDSRALELISQDGVVRDSAKLYREALRPQLHFSARRGWLNDPNGLVFYRGEYHLFFQHNPYGWSWGNMHWGHAVSRDLLHWQEQPEALYPDEMGPMFSGSAVVDWKNSSGFGRNGEPPIVLIYTAAGNPTVQCLAYSTDRGRTFHKFTGNPVLKQITPGNRDPKVFWHAPSRQWVMTLYVGFDEMRDGKKTTRHTIQFLTSPNLKHWSVASETDGFFECPDFFELPVDGKSKNRKWILTAASAEYMVGSFDGRKFTPETGKLPGHYGKGFYAPQTYSDMPDARRIQFGWLQAPSPNMSFNQCMSLPQELKLVSTAEGIRITREVISLSKIERARHRIARLMPGHEEKHALTGNSAFSVTAEFEPDATSELRLVLNGLPISYSAATQRLQVKDQRAPAPLNNGKQKIIAFVDRTSVEVFASDGLVYVPLPALTATNAPSVTVSLHGGALKAQKITVAEFDTMWRQPSR